MSRRQAARSGATGRYTVMSRPEGASLQAATEELDDLQWLQHVAGTDEDPRNVPESVLRKGVIARVAISEKTAQRYLSQAEFLADDLPNECKYPEEPSEDTIGFELEERVLRDRFDQPKLIAVRADGSREELLDTADYSSLVFLEPDFAEGDGNLADTASLNHVNDEWLKAIAADEHRNTRAAELSHQLLDDLDWTLEPYNDKDWCIRKHRQRGAAKLVVRGKDVLTTRTFREAAAEDYATLLEVDEVDEDSVDMLKHALRISIQSPTPAMKHSMARQPIIEKMQRTSRVSHDSVLEAETMLEIHAGTAQPPRRGQVAKLAVHLNTLKSNAEAAKERVARAKAEADEFRSQAVFAGHLPPKIAEVVDSRQKSLDAAATSYETESALAAQKIEKILAGWKRIITEREAGDAEHAKLKAELELLDAKFEAEQH